MKRALIVSTLGLMACGTDAGPTGGFASGTSAASGALSGGDSGASGTPPGVSGTTSGSLGSTGAMSGSSGATGATSGASGAVSGTSGAASGTMGSGSASGASVGANDAGIDAAMSPDGGPSPTGSTAISTNRYDNSRTGATLTESILTPASVGGGKFGMLFSLPVDGTVQTQPLYLPGLTIQGKIHNVVFISTENDSIYAFDADAAGPALWTKSLGTAFTTGNADGTSTVFGCADLFPVVGVNSTPVIDTTSNTMYVLAKTSEGGVAHQFLHALDVTTGADRVGSPVEVTASVAGNGGGSVNGKLAFDPKVELGRAGLLLDNGVVYLAWAGHCDVIPWHGWLMAYDAKTLAQRGAYCDTPNGDAGGIWQSGMGLTSDATGVYFVSGNGDFDATGANGNSANKGMSVGRLTLTASGLTLVDSYTTHDAAAQNTIDNDLTTAAVIGPGTNYLYMSGKDSQLRVLSRASLGGFHAAGDQIVQNINLGGGHVHGGPVFWSGSTPTMFVWNESHQLKGYPILADGQLNTTPSTANIGYNPPHPGAIVTVSSNGTLAKTGVVWAATLTQAVSGVVDAAWHHIVAGELYAFDAENIAKPLWNSSQAPADNLGLFAKFSPPMVVNGKVYVGTATTTNAVRVYGLKP